MADYKHVVLLGIDGAGAYYTKTDTPNIDRIFKGGALTYRMRVTSPTSSAHSWGSCFHGCLTEHHGIVENDYVENNPYPKSAYHYPSFFKVIKEHYPEREVGVIYSWPGITGLVENDAGITMVKLNDTAAARYAIDEYIPEKKPTSLYIYFGSTDGTGHIHGYGSPEHLKQITYVDGLVGEIYDAVEKAGMLDDTLFMVVSDHGGIRRGHGGLTDEEKYAIFAAAGKTVECGEPVDMEIRDVAAIALYALGIDKPSTYTARVPRGVFCGVGNSERHEYHDPKSPRYHLPTKTRDTRAFALANIDKPLLRYASFDNSTEPFIPCGDIKYLDGYFGKCVKLDDGFLTLNGVDIDRRSVTLAAFIKTPSPYMDSPIFANKPCQDFDEVRREDLINGFVVNCMRNTYVIPPVHTVRLELVSGGRPTLLEAVLPGDYQYGWVHLAIVLDRIEGRASIYLDFKCAATMSVPWLKMNASLSDAGTTLAVGQDSTGEYRFKFGLSVDELLLFDGALTDGDITALGSYYREQ